MGSLVIFPFGFVFQNPARLSTRFRRVWKDMVNKAVRSCKPTCCPWYTQSRGCMLWHKWYIDSELPESMLYTLLWKQTTKLVTDTTFLETEQRQGDHFAEHRHLEHPATLLQHPSPIPLFCLSLAPTAWVRPDTTKRAALHVPPG